MYHCTSWLIKNCLNKLNENSMTKNCYEILLDLCIYTAAAAYGKLV